jgi:DNA-binding transcriptional regulator YiaG
MAFMPKPCQVRSHLASYMIDGNALARKIRHFRLKSRKTRKQFASELAASVKKLWGWETDRWQPSASLRE